MQFGISTSTPAVGIAEGCAPADDRLPARLPDALTAGEFVAASGEEVRVREAAESARVVPQMPEARGLEANVDLAGVVVRRVEVARVVAGPGAELAGLKPVVDRLARGLSPGGTLVALRMPL